MKKPAPFRVLLLASTLAAATLSLAPPYPGLTVTDYDVYPERIDG
ncbi:MAG: hypothetical protein RL216_2731 [Pseudomonadota bacterium]|jgi:hypothetical protein